MRKIIHTVGNMVKIPPEEEVCTHTSSSDIIFVGKMSYDPNIVAVTFFVNEIFPRLRNSYPDIKFTIIGANPTEQVKKLAETEGVKVTGFVDSIVPYFIDSTIVVAPMLTGAGIQNKIIQAMSHGCCVATTPTGAEGLTISNDEIAIYRTSDEWIDGLNELLGNHRLRVEMGKRAREYVIENLSPQIISRQFWDFIKSGGIE